MRRVLLIMEAQGFRGYLPRTRDKDQPNPLLYNIILKTLSLFFITFGMYINMVYVALHYHFPAFFTSLIFPLTLPNRFTGLKEFSSSYTLPPFSQTALSTGYFTFWKQSPLSTFLNKSHKYSDLSSNITSRKLPWPYLTSQNRSQVSDLPAHGFIKSVIFFHNIVYICN